MGQGEEEKTRPDPRIEIQERGEIFFFYRPRVDREEAHSEKDVQRMYLVLRPESGERPVEDKQDPDSGHGPEQVNIERQPLLRLIVMGRKSLPDKKGRPYWGFVEMVTTKIQDVKSVLQGHEYETSTKGHRRLPDSRPFGEGVYRILRHMGSGTGRKMHTHLVYKLKYPSEDELVKESSSSPQEALNITREASFLLQIKNPDQPTQFRGLQGKRKAAFPAHIQGLFGHQRYHPADPPDFLNYEGCEILLISASDDIDEELGLELKTEQQQQEADPECSDLIKTFGESGASSRPLLKAKWV